MKKANWLEVGKSWDDQRCSNIYSITDIQA